MDKLRDYMFTNYELEDNHYGGSSQMLNDSVNTDIIPNGGFPPVFVNENAKKNCEEKKNKPQSRGYEKNNKFINVSDILKNDKNDEPLFDF